MKRILPEPLLSGALLALWVVLAPSVDAANVLLGALIAIAVPWLSAPLRPMRATLRRPGVALRLFLVVLHDVLVANAQVAHGILARRQRAPRSAFVQFPLELRDPHGLAVLAIITTIVPGTVWSELALDRGMLMLHVFDVDDHAAFAAGFKARYERPLREIFE
jgi:multicomponent K+:H+ antiporter subunit E